jgi:hypothetical protein
MWGMVGLFMADVLTLPGAGSNTGVPAPYLQSTIYPVENGFGGNVALGMGSQTRRFQDIVSEEGQVSVSSAQLQSLFMAINQVGLAQPQSVNFNFEGLRGPPGIPGQTIVNQGRSGTLGGIGSSGADGADGADGVDAFDDIDIPIPYDGWEGAFTDNDPGAGEVSWTSFKLKYQGTAYTIAADDTALEYLYWDVNSSPTTLLSTATRSNAVGVGKFPVGWNNGGTFQNSQFIPLITAGFASFQSLSALGITVVNADIGLLAVETANIKDLNVTTLKIGNTNVTNPKLSDDAVNLTTAISGTSSSTTTTSTIASGTHPSGGDPINLSVQYNVAASGGIGQAQGYVRMYLNSVKVAEDYYDLTTGTNEDHTFTDFMLSPGSASYAVSLVDERTAGTPTTVVQATGKYTEEIL